MTDIIQLEPVDVAVCGGGPAGIGAAVAAARAGLKTLLIEANGCLGGTSTSGGLPMFLGATTGSVPFPKMIERGLKYSELPHPRKAVGGVFDLVVDRMVGAGGSAGICRVAQTDRYPGLDRLGCHDDFVFDIETGKRVFDSLMAEFGVTLRYYARVIDVKTSGGRIEGIYFADKSGISFLPVSAVIDCTGDADCVRQAGFSTVKGDPETGAMAIAGLVAHVENVDPAAVEKYLNEGGDPWFRPLCAKAREDHPDLGLPSRLIIFPMPQPGVFMINGGLSWGGYDGTSGRDLTDLTVRGRIEADRITKILLRRYLPGFGEATVRLTAYYPGIRETHRIVSEGPLRERDLLEGQDPGGIVALAGRHFDLQRFVGAGSQVFAEKGLKVKGGVAGIPYSALVPAGSKNIIAAGRCIDAEGQALGPARIMSTCMATGEAAGTAAALAVGGKTSFTDLDVTQLRKILRSNGAEVDILK
ncbi:MAG: FAD-dependent oxidoreductase [Clostridia bacterium]|nr:FAD-dependent oxidoreductase [Clostridia bacterium]